jgi:hypothetical protein
MASLYDDQLIALKNQLSSMPKRSKTIHVLLGYVEVFASKLIAQDFLVAHKSSMKQRRLL